MEYLSLNIARILPKSPNIHFLTQSIIYSLPTLFVNPTRAQQRNILYACVLCVCIQNICRKTCFRAHHITIHIHTHCCAAGTRRVRFGPHIIYKHTHSPRGFYALSPKCVVENTRSRNRHCITRVCSTHHPIHFPPPSAVDDFASRVCV